MAGLLQNQIAAVTGAGSGIGRAIAAGYVREGARVALLDINGEAAAAAAAELRAAGGTAQSFSLDVADRHACRTVAARLQVRSAQSRSWSTMPASTGVVASPATPTR